MKRICTIKLLLASVSALWMTIPAAHSQDTYTWTKTSGTFSWDDIANWSPGTGFANGIGNVADLSQINLTGTLTVHLNRDITLGELRIGDHSSLDGWGQTFISSGTGTHALVFDASSGNAILFKPNAANASMDTINAIVRLNDNLDIRNDSLERLRIVGGITDDSNSRAINKLGAGLLVFAGTNTYGGGTTVSEGTLQFNNIKAVAGTGRNVTVRAGATVALGYAIDNSFLNRVVESNDAFTIALRSDSSSNLDFGSSAGATLVNASLGAGLGGTGIFTYSGVLTPYGTTYRLGGGGGTLNVSSTLTDSSESEARSLYVGASSGGTVILSGANTYTGGTQINGGVLALGNVDALGPSGTISFGGGTLQFSASNKEDYSSRFSNAADQAYRIDTNGQRVGLYEALTSIGGSLTKIGLGTLRLSGVNTYTGATTISEGTLQIDGSTHASSTVAIGTAGVLSGMGTIHGNATLTGNGIINTSSATIAGTLGVTGGSWNGNGTVSGLVTASSGTFTIGNSATLTASSGVNVTGGTVVVNGTLSGGLTAAAGTTVYGSGTVTGTTTIAGNHNPGNSPGIQTFGDLSYTGGAAEVQWELNANTIVNSPVVFDQIIVDGDLDFTGATSLTLLFNGSGSTVNWTDSLWTSNQSWMIYDVSGTTTNFNNLQLSTIDWADSGGNLFNTSLNGSSFSLAQSGNDVILNYTVIPEPKAALLGGLGILLFLRRRRS
jgi:fibronectin-binding autotransporter adhesin